MASLSQRDLVIAEPALRVGAAACGLGTALPQRIVGNDEATSRLGVDAAWVERRTGIQERRWAAPGDHLHELAAAAEVVESIEAAGGRAVALQVDVTAGDAATQALSSAGEALGGPVLCLVNNAGIRDDDLAISLDDERWSRVIDTNLTAAFRMTREVLNPMIRARHGRIINIASVVGPRANPGQANYAAAKAGLIGLTRTVAAEVARRNVTVNAVAPGFVATEMTVDLPSEALSGVPARRAGTPEEVAACVGFLASNAASYVTGSTLYVDGGLAA